jgi:hypothetical protein
MDRLIGTTVKRNKNLEKKEEGKKKRRNRYLMALSNIGEAFEVCVS